LKDLKNEEKSLKTDWKMYEIKKDMLIERIENKKSKNIFKINFKDEK
jgi:hypothetical protein